MDLPTDRPRALALIQAAMPLADQLGGRWPEVASHMEADFGDLDCEEHADILAAYVVELASGALSGTRMRLAALYAEAAAELADRR